MTPAAVETFDPQLLRALRAAPWRTIEKRFLLILLGSISLHVLFASYVAAQPMPVTEEHFNELQDRFAGPITLPPLLPIPKAPVTRPVKVRPAPATSSTGQSKRVDPTRVAHAAVLKILGSAGAGGAFSGLLDAPVDEIARALDGAQAVRVLGSIEPIGPRGPAIGEATTIERLGTHGVKQVAIGTRSDKAPGTAVAGTIGVDDPDELDPRVLQQFITARRAAVQSCYERALRHNPGMKGGKVVLRMAIGAGGRVSGLRVEEDTLGSDAVAICMSTLMSRWIFPVSPKDEVPLSVPFVFARAN